MIARRRPVPTGTAPLCLAPPGRLAGQRRAARGTRLRDEAADGLRP